MQTSRTRSDLTARFVRGVLNVAVPAMAVGILLVSQALGRTQGLTGAKATAKAHPQASDTPHRRIAKHSPIASNHRSLFELPAASSSRATAAAAQAADGLAHPLRFYIRLVNRLMQSEMKGLPFALRIMNQRSLVNLRLTRLSHLVPANARRAAETRRQINRDIAAFNALTKRLARADKRVNHNIGRLTQRIERTLSTLQRASGTNPNVLRFVRQAEITQALAQNEAAILQQSVNATPFRPL